MRFGVELHQYLDAKTILAESRAVEELGYDALWLGDSQLIWRELYVLLGAAATATSSVTLGVGVTNPITRHPAVTASAIMTVQELSGGRGILGVGLGHTSVATMGLPRATRKQLTAYVDTVRRLCRGEEVPTEHGPIRLAFTDPTATPPIVIAASGPNMMRLAGQIGDGAIMAGQVGHEGVRRDALEQVRRGLDEHPHPPERFMVCAGVAAAVSDDRAQALEAVRPHVAQGLQSPLARLGPAALAAREELRTTYNTYDHMHPGARHAAMVPDDVIPEFAVAGTPEECARQAQAMFDAGVDEITIRPYALPGSSRLATIQAFARDVVPRLR
ncbi:MAG TPA: LLM class flavin-dependent oxidoreductase, partial [Chloroflexota bacterium]|nr:LLM class flavin-dependent oxidoreductase [Chloroflexota bacterium]